MHAREGGGATRDGWMHAQARWLDDFEGCTRPRVTVDSYFLVFAHTLGDGENEMEGVL